MHRYDDILTRERPRGKRQPMPVSDRAAQFAPFAALSGHEEAIEETARLTEEKITLDETEIARINETLYEISQHLPERRNVSITYFKPDIHKSGGAYLTDVGTIKKLDEMEKVIVMDSGMKISMEQIIEILLLS